MFLDTDDWALQLASTTGEGIVTLADAEHSHGLILLADSVRQSYDVPLICYDGGLTAGQRQALSTRLPNVTIRPIPMRTEVTLLRSRLQGDAGFGREEWLLWACPLLIASSPFRRTLWLDCDLVVLRNLQKLFRLLDSGPVFTPSDNKFGLTPNHSVLYRLLPGSGKSAGSPEPLINAGVIGFDLRRDMKVLLSYAYPVASAACDRDVRVSIRWHDQGALIWAVRDLCLQDRIAGFSWNCPVRALPIPDPDHFFSKYEWNHLLFAALREDFPGVNILHWNGRLNKLWHSLTGKLRGPATNLGEPA